MSGMPGFAACWVWAAVPADVTTGIDVVTTDGSENSLHIYNHKNFIKVANWYSFYFHRNLVSLNTYSSKYQLNSLPMPYG